MRFYMSGIFSALSVFRVVGQRPPLPWSVYGYICKLEELVLEVHAAVDCADSPEAFEGEGWAA